MNILVHYFRGIMTVEYRSFSHVLMGIIKEDSIGAAFIKTRQLV